MRHSVRCAQWTTAAAAVLALAGCAGASNPAPDTGAAPTPAAAAATPSGQQHAASDAPLELWAVQSGPLGVLVTDGAGNPLYRYEHDSPSPSRSTCTNACTEEWPPVIANGTAPPGLLGIDAKLVGTMQRADGEHQVTLAGWPLYRHVGDDADLTNTAGNGDDGAWYVVSPTGGRADPK